MIYIGGQVISSNMTRKHNSQRVHVQSVRKREERPVQASYTKKERKIESYLADDENFPSFSSQLMKMGLQLRDIPADGNCLFRALGDQLEGHCRNHFRHRQDVVRYILEHHKEFEPFTEDDVSFDTHIQNLKKLGVYAGNDAIVAFARLHEVNVVIHQLNAKHLLITGSQHRNARQLHISYHNGDHYSSVRKMDDNTESPANIRIQIDGEKEMHSGGYVGEASKAAESMPGYVCAMRGCQAIEDEVIAATNCQDTKLVRETLIDCHYDADATIQHLLQLLELTENHEFPSPEGETTSLTSHNTATTSGTWTDNNDSLHVYGTTTSIASKRSHPGQKIHFREDSYGGSSGYGSMSSNNGGARPKLMVVPAQSRQGMSSRKQKEIKKMEKKMRAGERHRQKILTSKAQQAPVVVYDDPTTLSISPRTASITRI